MSDFELTLNASHPAMSAMLPDMLFLHLSKLTQDFEGWRKNYLISNAEA